MNSSVVLSRNYECEEAMSSSRRSIEHGPTDSREDAARGGGGGGGGAEEAEWKSGCGAKGRDAARCQRLIKELIGKHEIKNEKLERREGHLNRRLQMLECSMPAVLVWQAWRSQSGAQSLGKPEKFCKLAEAAALAGRGSNSCRITPSRHYDSRVREIEARRKEAHRRAEEARSLWLEREAALQGKKARIELARRQQEERKERIEKLAAEARKLEESEGSGEGTDGNALWLKKEESTVSLKSSDLECLEKLESLAEAESCMRRRIAELEAKEEAYMRALARADELCLDEAADRDDLERARQEAEEANERLEACRAELERYRGVIKNDVGITTSKLALSDKDTEARPDFEDRGVQGFEAIAKQDTGAGRDDDLAEVRDEETCSQICTENKMCSSSVDTANKEVEAIKECVSTCVGRFYSQANKSVGARYNTRDKSFQARADFADKSGSTTDISEGQANFACGFTCGYPEDESEFGVCCPPDFVCNDVVDTATGIMTDASDIESREKVVDKATQNDLTGSEIDSSLVNDMQQKITSTSKYSLASKEPESLKSSFTSKLTTDSKVNQREAKSAVWSEKDLKSESSAKLGKDKSKESIGSKKTNGADDTISTKSIDSKKDTKSSKFSSKTTKPSDTNSKSSITTLSMQKSIKNALKSSATLAEPSSKSKKTLISDKKFLPNTASKKSIQSVRKLKTPSASSSRQSFSKSIKSQKVESKPESLASSRVPSIKESIKTKGKKIASKPESLASSYVPSIKEDIKSTSILDVKEKSTDVLEEQCKDANVLMLRKKDESEQFEKKCLSQMNISMEKSKLSAADSRITEVHEYDVEQDSKLTKLEAAESQLSESLDFNFANELLGSQKSSFKKDDKSEKYITESVSTHENNDFATIMKVRSIDEEAPSTIELSETSALSKKTLDSSETVDNGEEKKKELESPPIEAKMAIESPLVISTDSTTKPLESIKPEESTEARSICSVESEYLECCCEFRPYPGTVVSIGESGASVCGTEVKKREPDKKEVPKDKPDLSEPEPTLSPDDARNVRGQTDKDDVCICEPLARIMAQWKGRKLSCGCPTEEEPRQEEDQRSHLRRSVGRDFAACNVAGSDRELMRANVELNRRRRRPETICECSGQPDICTVVGKSHSRSHRRRPPRQRRRRRCHRCGVPICVRGDVKEACGCMSELERTATDAEPWPRDQMDERKIDENECVEDRCSRRSDNIQRCEATGSPTKKQDQGVLVKLPRTKCIGGGVKRLKLLFDGTRRRANRIRETIVNSEVKFPRSRASVSSVGSSCICEKNNCRC